jgi:predicted Fe-Mo cluster-binding NifX family protein
MNICIPVEDDKGLASQVCAHFGAAPAFMIVDSETGSCRVIQNTNQHHGHGMCAPIQLLAAEPIDCMVVGGIGGGALAKLNAANIQVYVSQQTTVAETVTAYKAGMLQAVQPHMACAHHGHGHS